MLDSSRSRLYKQAIFCPIAIDINGSNFKCTTLIYACNPCQKRITGFCEKLFVNSRRYVITAQAEKEYRRNLLCKKGVTDDRIFGHI